MNRCQAPATRRTWIAAATLLLTGCAAVAASGAAVPDRVATIAVAGPDPARDGERLDLLAAPEPPSFRRLSPGDVVHWPIEVVAHGATSARVDLELEATGELAALTDDFLVTIRGCSARWVGTGCSEGERTLVLDRPAATLSGPSDIGAVIARPHHWLLVSARLPLDADEVGEGTAGRLTLWAHTRDVELAEPTTPTTPATQPVAPADPEAAPGAPGGPEPPWSPPGPATVPPTGLAFTGVELLVLVLASVGAVLSGLALARAAGSRRVSDGST